MSIEAQLAELQEYSAKEKLEIVASFQEAQTAKEPGRTKFAEMLSFLQAGKAEGILSWHPDRLARNSIDGGQIVYMLDTGKIKDLKFPTFWFESTPQGKFMLNIAFGQSKYYVDNLSENIRRGHRAKLRRGVYPGSAPIGYLNNHRTRDIDIDHERAELIRKGFKLYATGKYTLKQIARAFKDMRLRSHKGNILAISCVQRMLGKSFYYGLFEFKGETYQGTHEPIITKKLFDTAQEILKQRGKPRHKQKNEPQAFCGLISCAECSMMITAEKQKGHIYYRCTKKSKDQKCFQPFIREEELDRQLINLLQTVSLRRDWAEKMLQKLDQEEKDAAQSFHAIVADKEREVKDITSKLQRLLDTYLDQIIDRNEYQDRKAKLLSNKKTLEESIARLQQSHTAWLEPMRKWVETASTLGEISKRNDLPSKKSSLQKIFGSNLTLHDKKIQENPSFPYAVLRTARQNFPESDTSFIRAGELGFEPRVSCFKGKRVTNYTTPQLR